MAILPTEKEDEFSVKSQFTLKEMKETLTTGRTPKPTLFAAAEKLAEEVDDFYAARCLRACLFCQHLLQTVQGMQRMVDPRNPMGALLALAGEMLIPDLMEQLIASGLKRKDLHTLLVAGRSDEQEHNEAKKSRIITPGR